MDFQPTADRQMLAETLNRYLQKRYPLDVRHGISASPAGWSSEHWGELADLGILGGLVPQTAGGFGGDGFDAATIFEQLGKFLVVEPFLGCFMGARALAGNADHEELVSDLVEGKSVLAVAYEEAQSRYDFARVETRAASDGPTWTLTGTKIVVPNLQAASHILVSARISGAITDGHGIGLFLIETEAQGISIDSYPLIDGGRAGNLTMTATPAVLIAEDGVEVLEDLIAAGIVGLSWEAIGIMDAIKATTLDYLRTRKQFGVAIGSFQALQHRMATLALEIEQARSAAINAANALQAHRQKRERSVSAAKFTIGRAGRLVAEEAIQLHGGMGMTWELPVSHLAKRLVMIGHQLGDDDYHLARFISLGRAA